MKKLDEKSIQEIKDKMLAEAYNALKGKLVPKIRVYRDSLDPNSPTFSSDYIEALKADNELSLRLENEFKPLRTKIVQLQAELGNKPYLLE